MDKKKKTIFVFSIIVLIIVLAIGGILIAKTWNNNNQEENTTNNEMDEFRSNSIMYDEDASLDELKEEYKITGPDELYEVQTEYDGRKAVVVKPEIDYKVAFAGMIKNDIPEFSEVDTIFNDNYPQGTGIWIDEKSRESVLNYLNNTNLLNNNYLVNDSGFLQVEKSENETDMDKDLENIINGDKLNILSVSGTYYMVDSVTGEIVKNPFEDLESTQTYDYVENGNDKIIFITENLEKKLTDDEIYESVIELLKY